MDSMLNAALPGNYLVDLFPFLLKLPPWMAKFKRDGRRAHEEFTVFFHELLDKSEALAHVRG